MDAILSAVNWELLGPPPTGWGGNLLLGLLRTIEIALCAYCLGIGIGLGGALGKIYGGAVLRWSLEIYTTAIRAVPELILILLLYNAGSVLLNQALGAIGIGSINISGLTAGIIALGVVQGAYSTEVLRGAMLAVPSGQVEAAAAFGLSWWQRQRRIVIPGMVPFAIPGLANLWLIVTKDTALLAVVGAFGELALQTQQAAGGSKAYFTFYVAAGALYLSLSLMSTFLFGQMERYYRRGQPRLD